MSNLFSLPSWLLPVLLISLSTMARPRVGGVVIDSNGICRNTMAERGIPTGFHEVTLMSRKSARAQRAKHTGAFSTPGPPASPQTPAQLPPKVDSDTPAWASVRAAEEANTISLRALRLNGTGVVLLIGTLLATTWAAYAASRSMSIAQDVLDGINRPYLIVEMMDTNIALDRAPQNYVAVRFRIKNVGGAPAIIDTYGARLGFEELPYSQDWKDSLGGSNIFVIEKDGYSPVLDAHAIISDADFRRKLTDEHQALVWRVNFSYFDVSKRRRNVYFTEYYQQPPFNAFRSNYPPRVEEVDFEPYKWLQRKNKVKSSYYFLKYKMLPWTKPNLH